MAAKNPSYSQVAGQLASELQMLNTALTARLDSIDAKIDHQTAMVDERLKPISDHEHRIRELESAIGALKVKYDLLTGGSFAASIGALIKAFLGL